MSADPNVCNCHNGNRNCLLRCLSKLSKQYGFPDEAAIMPAFQATPAA
ncbi:hypothetical protein HMPREF9080_00861 [Cardiobacterium valvarum F0432]|uniref:Uncharacterized protein n=1 Tax=Cardiobacterium valvarum F0432 TaxID=797473 RepID=G9ZDM7_9GAMM|nr:hypothetical protein HMPREF9080_00861 [Cardiobacterium valvarum F0432]